jgi:hypothetical protein
MTPEALPEFDVHVPIAAPPEHIRKFVCTIGKGEVEGCITSAEIHDLTVTADILERFGCIYNIGDTLIELLDGETLASL